MSMEIAHIKFVVGSRQLFSVPRQLTTISYALGDLLSGKMLSATSDISGAAHGYRILSAPIEIVPSILSANAGHIVGGFQSYRRYYIDMAGSFDEYMARFSSKTRSTFKRKRRKLSEISQSGFEIREYRTATEMETFLEQAIPLSRQTYQARQLDAGLPESDQAKAAMLALAQQDNIRAYLLFIDGAAVSYLYLPILDGVISYAFLGYHPDFAYLSPGTILQIDALERLFAENRYRYFDFTEGEGAHKAMFGTHHAEACSFFLLKANAGNRALLSGLKAFDGSVSLLKSLAEKAGVNARIRKSLRG